MCSTEYCCDGWIPTTFEESGRPAPGSPVDRCPECMVETRERKIKERFPSIQDLSTFKNEIANREKIVDAASEFSWNSKKYLFLVGIPGVGKTHLALMVLLKEKRQIAIISAMELFRIFSDMAAGYRQETVDSFEMYQKILDSSMMLIDDLNIETRTIVQQQYFQNFLDRYNGKIIFTSNHPPDKLGFNAAVQSRLGTDSEERDSIRTALCLTGKNYRGKK